MWRGQQSVKMNDDASDEKRTSSKRDAMDSGIQSKFSGVFVRDPSLLSMKSM
jgi:hypothetical protein